MSSQSLLITFSYPPQIRGQDILLEDHVRTEIKDVPVFGASRRGIPMHDLLVDRETKTLAGHCLSADGGRARASTASDGIQSKLDKHRQKELEKRDRRGFESRK